MFGNRRRESNTRDKKRLAQLSGLLSASRESRAVLDVLNDAVLLLSQDCKILYVNAAAQHMFRGTRSQLVGRFCWEAVHGSDTPFDDCPVETSKRSAKRESSVRRVRDRWMRFVVDPILDGDGRFLGAIETAVDITASKHLQEGLALSEKRLEQLVEQSPLAISVYTPDGQLVSANPSFWRIWGVSPRERGDVLATYNLLHDEQARNQGLVPKIEAAFAGESIDLRPYKYDAQLTADAIGADTSSAQSRWVHGRLYPLPNDEGDVQSVVLMEEDVTARVEAEVALRASQSRYETLVESTTDGIVIVQDERLAFVNSAMPILLGYSPDEMIGQAFEDCVAPEYRGLARQRYADRLAGREVPPIYEAALLRKDSTPIPVEVNSTTIEFEGAPATLVFLRDISQRKAAEEQLLLAFEETIAAFARTVEARDPYTAGHQERVASLAVAIAKKMGLSENQVEGTRVSGLLHDIGKIAIPAELLTKPARLTPLEFQLIQQHSTHAVEILGGINFPWPVSDIIAQHHERIDGSGYPRGLRGDDILIEARILAVADTVEAMAAHRPYRPALGIEAARDVIREERGATYDPDVVDACLKLFEQDGYELPQ